MQVFPAFLCMAEAGFFSPIVDKCVCFKNKCKIALV